MTQTFLEFEKKNAKDRLYEWLLQKKWARTSEVCEWGVKNYSPDRASRNARLLAEEGKIFRMREDLQDFRFGKIGEDVWTIYKHEAREEKP